MELKAWCNEVPGRQKALAEYLGKSQATVSQAVNGAIRVPPDWYRGIVDFTKRKVSFDDLAPRSVKQPAQA